MTEKLYDRDAYLRECDALVTKCEKEGENYKIYLDKTIFFARGGGQLADMGTIDGIEVIDVYEDKTGHVHLTNAPVEEGKTVKCLLDWDFRFDQMQQHMGQHIFSAVAETEFNAKTVAARIEHGTSHVELDRKLTNEEMFALNKRVNEVIAENRPIFINFYTKDEAQGLGLPAKAFTHEIIRVVTIENLDVNPCGGTHPHTTGEVEKCVITGTKDVRGVWRIYYKFGNRAKANRFEVFEHLLAVQDFFGVQDKTEVMPELTKLKEKYDKAFVDLQHLKAELAEADCKNLLAMGEDKGDHKLIIAHLEEKNLIKTAIDKAVLENQCAVMVTNKSGDTLNLIMAMTKGMKNYNMGAVVREFMASFPGKGGGGPAVAQCTVPYSDEALALAKELIEKQR